MSKYAVPANVGKVRVAMALGGKYAVWNGKHGKLEFRIIVRTRKQADEIARQINGKQHGGVVEVWE